MDSVRTALRVFEFIAINRDIGVSELARRLDEPKSTVQRSLATLHAAGWIRPVAGSGRRRSWEVSLRVFTLTRTFRPVMRLRRAALPHMRALRDATGETIHLMAPDGPEVVLIERIDSTLSLRTVRRLGVRAPLHVASNGKAVMAALPTTEVDAYLAGDLAAWTPHTIIDPQRIRADLIEVRRLGYATSIGEFDDGVNAVAAAILDPEGRPAGSLSISCPAVRLPRELIPERGLMVAEAARAIGRDLAAWAERPIESDQAGFES